MGSSDPTLTEKTYRAESTVHHIMFWPAVAALSLALSVAAQEEEQILQDDPCLARSKVVGDVQYCDRYWECEFGQPELYDCPNGLVWVGKNQGIADGCDYPWRHTNICKDKDLANPPQSTEHCDWLYGIFGHETSCTRYWTCWMAQRRSNSALAASFTTRRPTPVTGPRMLPDARSILCARMTQTEMCPSASPATDTGLARADTPVCSAVPPCLCSTRTAGAA